MKVDHLARAQQERFLPVAQEAINCQPSQELPYPVTPGGAVAPDKYASLYPSLDEYMGLSLTSPEAVQQRAVAIPAPNTVAVPSTGSRNMMVAPLSGSSLGLQRAAVTHGIREVVICKDKDGKVGMRMQPINKGIFVVLVQSNTPAALAGLRFGDQVLAINDVFVAGFTMDKVHDLIKKANPKKIAFAVRDRPFERTITMHKDSVGNIGFAFKNGKIISLVKDSSAARNGLLTEHYLLEVNGQNVVGLKDKQVHAIIDGGGQVVTVTVMPAFVYDHMMKYMASSLAKKLMDHSIPDL